MRLPGENIGDMWIAKKDYISIHRKLRWYKNEKFRVKRILLSDDKETLHGFMLSNKRADVYLYCPSYWEEFKKGKEVALEQLKEMK